MNIWLGQLSKNLSLLTNNKINFEKMEKNINKVKILLIFKKLYSEFAIVV